MFNDFFKLCDKAVKITEPIVLCWPSLGNAREVFRPEVTHPYEHHFATKNGVVAFVWKSSLYVLPATESTLNIIQQSTPFVVDEKLIVPFAHGEIPEDNQIRSSWEALKAES